MQRSVDQKGFNKMEKALKPAALTRAEFLATAVAVGRGDMQEVFVGSDSLGKVKAAKPEHAIAQVHEMYIRDALEACSLAHDSSRSPSTDALREYPALCLAYPVAARNVLELAVPDPGSHEASRTAELSTQLIERLEASASSSRGVNLEQGLVGELIQALMAQGAVTRRHAHSQAALGQLLDAIDLSSDQADLAVERARAVFESAGNLSYPTWMAGVRSSGSMEAVDEKLMQSLYRAGAAPAEARACIVSASELAMH
jgi:hypothetical protein